MNQINYFMQLFLLLLMTLFLGCQPEESTHKDSTVTVLVKTTKLAQQTIQDSIKTYGQVIPLPGHVQSISVLYDSIITKILVTEGVFVSPGRGLVDLTPSPASILKLKQAEIEADVNRKKVKLLQNSLQSKLSTRQELIDAKQMLEISEQTLKMLQNSGIRKHTILKARSKGIVWQIHVRPGEIVGAGQEILSIVPQKQKSVIVGIEPHDQNRVHRGEKVFIQRASENNAEYIQGIVSMLTHQINPQTHLLNIVITPTSNFETLLLNDTVTAKIILSSKKALVVPPTALQPEKEGYSLFTIENNHARYHHVITGIRTQNFVEILGKGLHQGMHVVTLGNYELQNGMAVREEVEK